MILVATNHMAMVPFPCTVYIECVSAEADEHGVPKRLWKIMAGDYVQVVMAQYTSPVPAKMELQRLLDEAEKPEAMQSKTFKFVKEEV